MIISITLFSLIFCISFAFISETTVVERFFREQLYDHFQTNYYELWDQRYFLIKSNNTQDSKLSKLNLIFICNHSLTYDKLSCIPPFFDEQKRNPEVNIILLEMRYHGQSQPYSSRYFGIDTYEYQSVQQNIADIANFISSLQKDKILNPNSKNILIGQNLSGSISTWTKIKYPHLINGVIAFNSQLTNISYDKFNKLVYETLQKEQPGCQQTLDNFLLQINEQLQEEESAKQLLQQFLFKNHVNENIFLYYLYELVQKQMETSQSISQFCALIKDQSYNSIITNLSSLSTQESRTLLDIQEFTNTPKSKDQSQVNIDKSNQQQSENNSKNVLAPTLRLYCTDIGFSKFYLTEKNVHQENILFKKIPSLVFKQICKTLFNQKQLPNEDRLIIQYGGVDVNHQNTLFVNDMTNINSISFKNGSKINQNGGNTQKIDGIGQTLSLTSQGEDITSQINNSINQWINHTSKQEQVQNNSQSKSEKNEKKQEKSQKKSKNKKKKVKKVKISKVKKNSKTTTK